MPKPVKSGPLWNKIPQLLNLARYKMLGKQIESVLDYEPWHLQINPLELQSQSLVAGSFGKKSCEWDKQSFRFLLEQVPTVRTVEFACVQADPLALPSLFELIDQAYQFNGAESTVITEGWHLASRISEIVNSRLSRLVIRLAAHRPSQYALMTKRPIQQFVILRDLVAELVRKKREQNSTLNIELSMLVDFHNYEEIPDMIRFAESMGVQGIVLENFYSPVLDPKLDRTLFSDNAEWMRYLDNLKQSVIPKAKVTVTVPKVRERNMKQHRFCVDAYSTVSVDSEMSVSPCSRQLISYSQPGKIWDEDFFNNSMYQWMRSVHCKDKPAENSPGVPLPCQSCPQNLPYPQSRI